MTDPTPTPDPTPAPAPAPTPAPAPEPKPDEPKTFTQEDVNALMARQKRELLAEQPDLTELRAKAKKYDEIEEANRSELEKAQKEADEARAEAAKLKEAARTSTTRSAIMSEAAKAERKLHDPSAAVDFLMGADSSLVELDEDGTPKNIAEAMDELLKKRPYLVATGGGRRDAADQGARGGNLDDQVTREELANMSDEEKNKALRDGRLQNILAGKA